MVVFIRNLQKLLDNSISPKQKKLLITVRDFEGTASKLVKEISGAPHATMWHNLRSLRDKGLIEFSKNIKLTQLGVIAARLAVDQQDRVQFPEPRPKNKEGDKNGKR